MVYIEYHFITHCYVLQDVVADAMTVEAVPNYDKNKKILCKSN